MKDFKLDTFGQLDLSSGDLQFVTGADAVAQHLKIRLRFFSGEWFLDTRIGIPYFASFFVKQPNLSAIESIYRRAITTTPGVDKLERYDQTFDRDTRELSVSFSARLAGDDVATDFNEVFIL